MSTACSTSRSTCVCIPVESGGGQVSETEICYDANYGFAVAPAMMIEPFRVHTASRPGDHHRASGNDTHALFFGALSERDLAHLLGLPAPGGKTTGQRRHDVPTLARQLCRLLMVSAPPP
jgi:hypothetical protein